MKKINYGVGAVIVLVLGYILAAPYITVYQMKTAAESHNGEALSEHVDFPALRQSLKDQMNVMLGTVMAKETKRGNLFVAFGAAFAGMMVEKMVDVYVTPVGITELMKGDKTESEGPNGDTMVQAQSKPLFNASMSYESFSKFSITTRNSEPGKEVKFILRRRGMGWKLTEIIIPLQNLPEMFLDPDTEE
ncbi:MAG: DUF2939 domain-containing protein [Nitrospirae bacterium]|nr:DUF2939 domain-containing protein [Nitrospirota bacterium]